MKSILIKTATALTLLGASAFALASNMGCCDSLECCLKMLAGCC